MVDQKNTNRKLGIYAHADDEVICGWPFMQSDGEKHLCVIAPFGKRFASLQAVCDMYGVQLHLAPSTEPGFSKKEGAFEAISDFVIKLLDEVKPDEVHTHNQWGEYGHPDHVMLHEILSNLEPVFSNDLQYGSFVWVAPEKIVANSSDCKVFRDDALWLEAQRAYGEYWTTNGYIKHSPGAARRLLYSKKEASIWPKPLICWMVDVYGWAFYNQATALGSKLKDYVHRIIYPKANRETREYWFDDKELRDMEQAEVIVSMTPAGLTLLPGKFISKSITRISGWRRLLAE